MKDSIKKNICGIMAIVVMLCLASCGANQKGADDETEPVLLEMTSDAVTEQTGIELSAPEEATNITYDVVQLNDGSTVAEMSFNLDGISAFERAEVIDIKSVTRAGKTKAEIYAFLQSDDYNITGFVYEWDYVCSVLSSVFGKNGDDAVVKTCGNVGYFAWMDADAGILYNIGVHGDDVDSSQVLKVAVAVFNP